MKEKISFGPEKKNNLKKPAEAEKSSPKAQVEDNDFDLPVLDLEEHEVPEEGTEEIKDETKGSIKFGWIGAGQCGGRMIKSFYDIGYRKAIAINTAQSDLSLLELPEKQKMLLDIGKHGAGKDMARGRDAASKYKQEVFDLQRKIFGKNVDHIMVCIGAGGGTGGGTALSIIETAKRYIKYIGKEANKNVGVIMTLPTYGEATSPIVAKNALQVLTEVGELARKSEISPLIIIDNDKINKMFKDLTVKEFWVKINNTVAGLFDIFNRLSALNSQYTSFDPVDYKSTIESGGCTIMGVTKAEPFETEQDISKAVKGNLSRTLLASGFDLSTSKVAASIAVGGPGIFSTSKGLQDRLNYGFDILSNLCEKATIHRGIYQGGRETLRIYTIIGGLNLPNDRIKVLQEFANTTPEKDSDFDK